LVICLPKKFISQKFSKLLTFAKNINIKLIHQIFKDQFDATRHQQLCTFSSTRLSATRFVGPNMVTEVVGLCQAFHHFFFQVTDLLARPEKLVDRSRPQRGGEKIVAPPLGRKGQ
jgi:hypothetical protein